MSCFDPAVGRLILRYEMRELTEEDELRYEAHVLACRRCFEDLRALARTAEVLLRHPGEAGRYLGRLAPASEE